MENIARRSLAAELNNLKSYSAKRSRSTRAKMNNKT